MRTQHPLFGFDPLGDAWDAAGVGHDFQDDRRDALFRLAKSLERLPAPVYFQVPPGVVEDERWQHIISASEPQCNCTARRLLLPPRGRARFMPHTTPQRVTLQPGDHMTRHQSLMAAALPQGGDLAAAHLAWLLDYDAPVCLELPFQEQRPTQQLVDIAGMAARYLDGRLRLGYNNLCSHLWRRGEIFCYWTFHGPTGRVVFPICSIVEAGNGPGASGVQLVVEFDASVSHQLIDPMNMPPLHVCAA